MRGRVKVFSLASVALLSCRAVLGIEDIEATTDAGTDSGATDAAADSVGIDSAADAAVDSADAGACTTDCNVCCREPLKGTASLPELEKVAKQAGCICGDAGVCAAECSAICNGTGMPGPDCIKCLDTAVISGAKPECGKTLTDCSANTTCKPLGDCLKTCKN